MPYIAYDTTKPDSATQNIAQFGTSIRTNELALRDAAILSGGFPGFNLAVSGGTASQPALLTYSKGVERVKATLTWGTAGGEAGNVVSSIYSYSANSGVAYDVIGTKTVTYDGLGNVLSTTWS